MTNAELAVLSLIIEKPRYGYDIERVIEERGMREWTDIGFSSIYYILNKLAKDGYVEARSTESAGHRPARKVYHTTSAGRAAWHEATLEALSVPQRRSSPLQIGLSNLFGIPHHEALAALQSYREALRAHRDHVIVRRDAQRPLHMIIEAMFDQTLSVMDAELAWLDNFIQQLEAAPKET